MLLYPAGVAVSTISSASTDAEVQAAYDDNASYVEDNSVDKAKAFITACRLLIRRIPTSIAVSGRSATRDSLKSEIDEAYTWLKSRLGAGRSRVLRVDFLEPEGVD